MWLPNIRCRIKDGKAYLADECRIASSCQGECCFCDLFMGVNLQDVGKESLSAFCVGLKAVDAPERRLAA